MDHLRGKLLGAKERGRRFTDVSSLCVRPSYIKEKTGLPFWGQT
ncbi:hypothetical protein LI90_3022 [Carbonactinospora thermoautotrophica]|uniref:Uncharacterized protein n=1 Tax=Carbonactinospora thermoautotrophica TaxID=1469144 RepID=A0A132MVY9_9ACTN|nr:hypothetical protein LI90_3022 [Carbonactinospora thermoautotrophica]